MAYLRKLPVPAPPPYGPGVGVEYATKLAERGQALSFTLLVAGWLFVISAGLCALLGTTARTEFEFVTTSAGATGAEQQAGDERTGTLVLRSGTSNYWSANLGIIFGAVAIVCAGVGWQCLDRSSAASLLAKAATKAIGHASSVGGVEADLRAYGLCIEAKASWLDGRMNHDRIDAISSSLLGGEGGGPSQSVASHKPPGGVGE